MRSPIVFPLFAAVLLAPGQVSAAPGEDAAALRAEIARMRADLDRLETRLGAVEAVDLAAEMRFPWSGGRHPWLDVAIMTHTTLVGVAARRYEPFRPAKQTGFADVYDRPVWGPNMARYTALALQLIEGTADYRSLNAAQLVKDAYGIRTRASKRALGAVLVYLYAEPAAWASGKPVDAAAKARHRAEIARFGATVAGDDVVFVPLRWGDLLRQWAQVPALSSHVAALRARFGDLG